MNEKLDKEMIDINRKHGDRIEKLSNRCSKHNKTQVNIVWDLSELWATLDKDNASTQAKGKIREDSFPNISKYDLSNYIYIGKNIANVKRYYNHFGLKLTSAKRIADRYKKALKEAADKVEAIKEKRKAIKEHAETIKNASNDKEMISALTKFQERVQNGEAITAPTTDADKLEKEQRKISIAFFAVIDKARETPLTDEVFESMCKSFDDFKSAYMKERNKVKAA